MQEQGVYEGEISFFIADPLHLDKMVSEIKGIDSIAWTTMSSIRMTSSILRLQNSFKSMQKIVVALIAVAAVLGFLVFMLILTFRIRGRMQEAGYFTCRRKTETADYRAISDRGNDSAVDRLSSGNHYLSSACRYIKFIPV